MSEQGITLQDILAANDRRQLRRQTMREKYGTVLASITLNIPGPVKDGPRLRQLLDYAIDQLRAGLKILAEDRIYPVTGPEALLAVEDDAEAVKQIALATEENHSFGRLLDIDVFTAAGELLSRRRTGQGRTCLLCGELAVNCMRGRRHSSVELQQAVGKLLVEFQAYQSREVSLTAEKIGGLAVEAMLYEAASTPAPGLVDRVNSGAHRDMDFYSFMASSAALSFTMARTAQAGFSHNGLPLPALLPVLRLIGREGEAAMLAATGGVNTQKGLLFSLGIITAAAGWLHDRGLQCTAASVLAAAAEIVSGIVERELGSVAAKEESRLTAGERLYRDYGVTGIRGELAAGLPAVGDQALPALRQALAAGFTINDALIHTLLVLMTCVEDTTVMNRHDPATMRQWVREKAQAVLDAGGMGTVNGREKAAALDDEFIARNVSPGGTADLLAVTWFLHRLEEMKE
ncbi:MAG: triphosphoribosyl-dephospho-CoA synthase CitG [Veillonellales bacterium]